MSMFPAGAFALDELEQVGFSVVRVEDIGPDADREAAYILDADDFRYDDMVEAGREWHDVAEAWMEGLL